MTGHAQPIRLADVAARAGVSIATASRVLNGSQRMVGEPHRSRVLAAAAELAYTPNANAQAVARGASNMVGLIVHDITDPYFSTIAAGITALAEERGTAVLLANTRRQPELELEYLATLSSQRARAVIIVGSRYAGRKANDELAKALAAFRSGGGRAACISQNRLAIDTVVPQNHAAARRLGQALVDLGHRHFAVLAGPEELLTARDRLRGFSAGVTAQPGVTLQQLHGPFTRDGGYGAAVELIEGGLEATCLFAVNDVMAVGAIAALRDHGLQVPTDVSVAGFDDIETLRDLLPPLTTVRLPLEKMGSIVAGMALDDDQPEPRVVKVEGDVVLRASTRAVKAANDKSQAYEPTS
jgi:LacI family transcriptional regulator